MAPARAAQVAQLAGTTATSLDATPVTQLPAQRRSGRHAAPAADSPDLGPAGEPAVSGPKPTDRLPEDLVESMLRELAAHERQGRDGTVSQFVGRWSATPRGRVLMSVAGVSAVFAFLVTTMSVLGLIV